MKINIKKDGALIMNGDKNITILNKEDFIKFPKINKKCIKEITDKVKGEELLQSEKEFYKNIEKQL